MFELFWNLCFRNVELYVVVRWPRSIRELFLNLHVLEANRIDLEFSCFRKTWNCFRSYLF